MIKAAVLLISISKQQQKDSNVCTVVVAGRHAQHDNASSKRYENIPWTDYRHVPGAVVSSSYRLGVEKLS